EQFRLRARAAVQWPAARAREDESALVPLGADKQSLLQLPTPMRLELLADVHRHRQGPPAAPRLQLDELVLPFDLLKLLAHVNELPLEVDVDPLEAERLALPESKGERHRVESLEPIASCCLEQPASLLGCQRVGVTLRHARDVDERSDVPT